MQQQGGSRSWGAGETGRESGHGSWEDAGSCARWPRARPSAPKVGTTRGTPGQPGLAQPGRGTAGPGGAEAGPPLPPCPCVPQGSGTPSYQKRPPHDTVHSAGWPGPSATPRLWACASPPRPAACLGPACCRGRAWRGAAVMAAAHGGVLAPLGLPPDGALRPQGAGCIPPHAGTEGGRLPGVGGPQGPPAAGPAPAGSQLEGTPSRPSLSHQAAPPRF